MPETATLVRNGKTYELPVVVGTENEHAVDISKLRQDSGYITLDDGYGNTGSCKSAITFIDGEQGHPALPRHPDRAARREEHLRRDRLAADLRRAAHRRRSSTCFSDLLTEHEMLHEGLYKHFEGFPSDGHPMAILSAMINAVSCYQPGCRRAWRARRRSRAPRRA